MILAPHISHSTKPPSEHFPSSLSLKHICPGSEITRFTVFLAAPYHRLVPAVSSFQRRRSAQYREMWDAQPRECHMELFIYDMAGVPISWTLTVLYGQEYVRLQLNLRLAGDRGITVSEARDAVCDTATRGRRYLLGTHRDSTASEGTMATMDLHRSASYQQLRHHSRAYAGPTLRQKWRRGTES